MRDMSGSLSKELVESCVAAYRTTLRKPAEVLELALTLLDENKCDSHFMCLQLDWMEFHNYITQAEKFATRTTVMCAISPWRTLGSHLRSVGVLSANETSGSAGYRKHQVKFYTDLINKLKQEES